MPEHARLVAGLVALGGLAGAGLVLVATRLPWWWRPTLEDRLVPYLAVSTPASDLLAGAGRGSGAGSAAHAGDGSALLSAAVTRLDGLLGGRASVARRLRRLGPAAPSVEAFRQQQVAAGAAGGLLGGCALALRLGTGAGLSPLALAAATLGLVVLGVWGRDQLLTRQVRRRQDLLTAQLPAAAELLALAVSAGEPPLAAVDRVARVTGGALGAELAAVVADVRAGASLGDALAGLLARTDSTTVARFVDGLRVAISRGTPLAEVLRAQAADARDAAKRALLEAGGRNEVRMLVPVVFLILPVTLLFALYPAAITLTSLTH